MDKTWVTKSRVSEEYLHGVVSFLDFAFSRVSHNGLIVCPCAKCANCVWKGRKEVFEDLLCDGFVEGYTTWFHHGEKLSEPSTSTVMQDVFENTELRDDVENLLREGFGMFDDDNEIVDDGLDQSSNWGNIDVTKFNKLLQDASEELYPGCTKFSKLSFLVKFLILKCRHRVSNKAFSDFLKFFKDVMPQCESLPNDYAGCKHLLKNLGLGYNKIHACPNNCMLFWEENAKRDTCAKCGASRWQGISKPSGHEQTNDSIQLKKIPAKVLRHFPLIPRLQRLYMSSKTANFMRWHEEDRTKDGQLRHPADSLAWHNLDAQYPIFAQDSRNVRLGLASDGFNPFSIMSVSYSIWPVVILNYNLPPWMCMKRSHFILSLLIPGPNGPGNDIDVYLQPLVKELMLLWDHGVRTYDASKNETFQMRAALLWTINDFPAYANLSGWSTKGRWACPICNKDTCHQWLPKSKKFCYQGHRRFLQNDHRWRCEKHAFDGNTEFRQAPTLLSGSQVLDELKDVTFPPFGKSKQKNKKKSALGKRKVEEQVFELPYSWRKKSIFFELPYWKDNLLRHNLDVMHIEKNVCESLINTLLGIKGKTKDGHNARFDLQELGIRSQLHPQWRGGSRYFFPPSLTTLTSVEKSTFLQVLRDIKVPDAYSSNISRKVLSQQHKISGLKSHDCHILMQQLLPVAIRRVLPKEVSSVLVELCGFFKGLCSKVLQIKDLENLEERIALTLCQMEKIFPPSFFDIMVHLPIHLATEAKLAGPVQYRWMYPMERYLFTCKSYVRNKSRPEGSIAEGYLAEECLTFCSRYLENFEASFSQPSRNPDGVGVAHRDFPFFSREGYVIGKEDFFPLNEDDRNKAHRYVLFNSDIANSFIEEHRRLLLRRNRRARPRQIDRMSHNEFHTWFKDSLYVSGDNYVPVPENLRWLARGPDVMARRFGGYIINGFRFHTLEHSKSLKTQNYGVFLRASTISYTSSVDNAPTSGDVDYYGLLTDIIELDYYEERRVVLFRCKWFNVEARDKGMRKDELGFTLVNFKETLDTEEPYILASQAEQVFYVQDPFDNDWHVVIKTRPRDVYEMEDVDIDRFWESESCYAHQLFDDNFSVNRPDVPGVIVDVPEASIRTNDDNVDDNDYDE